MFPGAPLVGTAGYGGFGAPVVETIAPAVGGFGAPVVGGYGAPVVETFAPTVGYGAPVVETFAAPAPMAVAPPVQTVERVVEVPELVIQEVVRQVPRIMTQEVVKQVPVPQLQTVEKLVEVPQVQTFETIVPVPQVQIQEVVRQVGVAIPQEVVRQVPVPQVQTVEKVVEVPQTQVMEKVVMHAGDSPTLGVDSSGALSSCGSPSNMAASSQSSPDSRSSMKGAPICLQGNVQMTRLAMPLHEKPSGLTAGELESRLQQYRSEVLDAVQNECSSLLLKVNALMRQDVMPLKQEMKAMSSFVSLQKLERSDEVTAATTHMDEKLTELSTSINVELEKMVAMVNAVSSACDKHFERLAAKHDKCASALVDVRQELSSQLSIASSCDERVGILEAELRQKLNLFATKEETMEAVRQLKLQEQEQMGELRQGLDAALSQFERDRWSERDEFTNMLQIECEERSQQNATFAEFDAKFEERLREVERTSEKTILAYEWMISRRAKDKNVQIECLAKAPQTLDQYRADLSHRSTEALLTCSRMF